MVIARKRMLCWGLFNGEYPEPVTGHYLLGNGYRADNPVLMRFNQPDSLSPFGRGGLNAYAYCQGDPVNRRDPSGHISSFRVSGLTMFLSGFPLEKLPDVAFAKVLAYLPGEDLVNLSRTSSTMDWRVTELSKVPKINSKDPVALQKVEIALKGKRSGALAAKIKKDVVYKAAFEGVAATRAANIQEQMANLSAQIELLDINRGPQAAFPGVPASNHEVARRQNVLFNLARQRSELSALTDRIRRNLNPRQ